MDYPKDFNWFGKITLFPIVATGLVLITPVVALSVAFHIVTKPLDEPTVKLGKLLQKLLIKIFCNSSEVSE